MTKGTAEPNFRKEVAFSYSATPLVIAFFFLVLTKILVNGMLSMTKIIVNMTTIYDREERENMSLGNRLREQRARLGLNQQQLGQLVGASRQTISLIERGDYHPSVLLALRIARVFDLPLEEIFFLEGEDGNETKE